MDNNAKVDSLNLELVDSTSLQFSKLAPNPSLLTQSVSINCDCFSNALKSALSITFVVKYFSNDWACNFDKLKWVLTFMDTSFLYFSFFWAIFQSLWQVTKNFNGFDWGSRLRLKWSLWYSMNHLMTIDRWWGNSGIFSVQPGSIDLSRCIWCIWYALFFVFFFFLLSPWCSPFPQCGHYAIVVWGRGSYAFNFWKQSEEFLFKKYFLFLHDFGELHYLA